MSSFVRRYVMGTEVSGQPTVAVQPVGTAPPPVIYTNKPSWSRRLFPSLSNKVEPLVQHAQKCAWCGHHLLGGEQTAQYNGEDPLYKGWECHSACNVGKQNDMIIDTVTTDDPDFVDLEAQKLPKKKSISTTIVDALLGNDD